MTSNVINDIIVLFLFIVLSSSVSGSISVPFSNVLPEGAALGEYRVSV